MLRRFSVFGFCLIFLLYLVGCGEMPDQKVEHVYQLVKQAREGSAPEDYAGVQFENGGPTILYVTEDSTHSLGYWQKMVKDPETRPSELRKVKYSANDAYAWWYEIKSMPYGETYIDYAFTLTAGLELDETLGYRVYLEVTGDDAADVQALLEEKYGDFIQPLTDEKRSQYGENKELLVGESIYREESDRTQLNEIERQLRVSFLDFKYETQAEWVEHPLPGGYPGYWDVRLHLDYWDAGAQEIKAQMELEWATGTVRVKADIDDDFAFETDAPRYSAGYTGSK